MMLPNNITDGQVLETAIVDEQQSSSVRQIEQSEMRSIRVSHLWSQPYDTYMGEIPDAQPDPLSMEEYHGIKPKVTKERFSNPWKFNTLKVMTSYTLCNNRSNHL